MAGQIKEVGKTGEVGSRKSSGEKVWNRTGYKAGKDPDDSDDSVLISEEARKRASGRHRKTILEHIAELEE